MSHPTQEQDLAEALAAANERLVKLVGDLTSELIEHRDVLAGLAAAVQQLQDEADRTTTQFNEIAALVRGHHAALMRLTRGGRNTAVN